jgi:hypothetical protein
MRGILSVIPSEIAWGFCSKGRRLQLQTTPATVFHLQTNSLAEFSQRIIQRANEFLVVGDQNTAGSPV